VDVQKDAKDALTISYETGGLVVKKPFAPWCAEWISVEARVSGQAETAQASDFVLSVSEIGEIACQQFSPGEGGVHLARFRFEPTGGEISFVVKFRDKALHSRPTVIPFLDRSAYIRQLNLLMPTVSCQFHGETVACKTYVSSQARNLVATCALVSEAGLAPLREFEPETRLLISEENLVDRWAIRLSNSQASGARALVSTVLDGVPKRAGSWDVVWAASEFELGRAEIAACHLSTFIKSLRMAAPRYFHKNASGGCSLLDSPVKLKKNEMLGPVFGIQSSLSGIAGQLPVTIEAIPKTGDPISLQVNTLMITDGFNLLAPGMLDASEVGKILGFRLMYRKQVLQACPADSRPAVRISSEGGFDSPVSMGWTRESENQLRLLMDTLSSRNEASGG